MRFIACLILLLTFFVADAALAQRRSSFGGSRSSSPSRSYSSPSKSYSSPAPSSRPSSSFGGSRSSGSSYSPPPRSSSPSSSGGAFGGSRSSGSGSVFGGSRSSSPSSVSRSSGSSAAKSYGIPRKETYGGQTYSYKGSSNAVGYSRSSAMIPRNYNYSYNDVYNRRNSYYSGMGYVAPSYIGYTSPSYGMFSTLFMLSALQNLQAQQNAMFYYNHWNTPSMMAYRTDMRTAAQSDPQAAQRLRELEARVAQLEREKGGVRDTTYMPAGVDSTVVLSNEALGVKDKTEEDRIKAEEELRERQEREKSKSSGNGFIWFVVIAGGAGTWWFLRRRKRQREESGGGGSFS